MTGYGNFSYFYKYNDFSAWRVCKLLFRLNFLVLMILMTMNTDYMLYYICPMHTLWFLSVYAMMAGRNQFIIITGDRICSRTLMGCSDLLCERGAGGSEHPISGLSGWQTATFYLC